MSLEDIFLSLTTDETADAGRRGAGDEPDGRWEGDAPMRNVLAIARKS